MSITNLNDKRPSVFYTVNVEHRWDGSFGLSIAGVGDDPTPRSKHSVACALKEAIEIIDPSVLPYPQPAQTQVALTAAPRYREWLHLTQVGMWTAGVPTWARDHDGRMNDGIAMRSVIEELAALLAAQPVSGGKS